MSNHTITDTIDGKAITAEEFLRQARRWAAAVRNAARRNTLRFTKGKKVTSITKKSGKVERKLRNSIQYKIEHDGGIPEAVSFKIPHPRDMEGMGGGLRPAPCSWQVREPAPAHPPLHSGLVRRTH